MSPRPYACIRRGKILCLNVCSGTCDTNTRLMCLISLTYCRLIGHTLDDTINRLRFTILTPRPFARIRRAPFFELRIRTLSQSVPKSFEMRQLFFKIYPQNCLSISVSRLHRATIMEVRPNGTFLIKRQINDTLIVQFSPLLLGNWENTDDRNKVANDWCRGFFY